MANNNTLEIGSMPETMHPADRRPVEKPSRTFANYVWDYREYAFDLLVIVSLLALFLGLEKATPRSVFITTETMHDYSYPYQDNTVPAWSVPILAFVLPVVVFSAHKALCEKTWRELYRTTIALAVAVLLTGAATNALKVSVARPRPNFVFSCWPDGKPVLRQETTFGGYAVCSADASTENEHRKSFPSGHASVSASGLGYLSFYLLAQTRAFTGNGHAWRIVVSLLPALTAVLVGVTRVIDYWHHPTDVVVGLLIGFGIAWAMFRQLYPPLTHPECDTPMFLIIARKEQHIHMHSRNNSGARTMPYAGNGWAAV